MFHLLLAKTLTMLHVHSFPLLLPGAWECHFVRQASDRHSEKSLPSIGDCGSGHPFRISNGRIGLDASLGSGMSKMEPFAHCRLGDRTYDDPF
jgi:hypothetical protein